ncbi:unnamed protein product [Thelazia callipaeda]|uniref:Phosphoglycerate mutase family protein n=1 Tax=Thelazia callipaeda TaxID=103827 RepID=A0A0N5CXM9_THECL|nr:unnamed protein product [Thelazia callipaeda]
MSLNERSKRTIWVIRHGERADNIDETWKDHAPRGAWDDPPLSRIFVERLKMLEKDKLFSDRGKHQARECGKRLETEKISVVLCSPFLRCVQTASGILEEHSSKLPLFIEQGLCETLNCCQYPPGCLSTKELSAQFPIIDLNYQPVVANPGPEKDIIACKDRLIKVIDHALKNYGNDILIVTHGSPTAMIREILIGEWLYVGQCTISKFVSDENGNFKAVMSSDSSHLSDRTVLRDNEYHRPQS